MAYSVTVRNLNGRSFRRYREYRMAVVTEPVYHGTQVVGSVPTYWPAITDVPCPVCDSGTIRWAEAGYVPGYRKCDGCGRHFYGAGTAENPTLILMGRRG